MPQRTISLEIMRWFAKEYDLEDPVDKDHWALISELLAEAWWVLAQELKSRREPRSYVLGECLRLCRKALKIHKMWKDKKGVDDGEIYTFDLVEQLAYAVIGGRLISRITKGFRKDG